MCERILHTIPKSTKFNAQKIVLCKYGVSISLPHDQTQRTTTMMMILLPPTTHHRQRRLRLPPRTGTKIDLEASWPNRFTMKLLLRAWSKFYSNKQGSLVHQQTKDPFVKSEIDF